MHYLRKIIESGAFRLEPPQNYAAMAVDIRKGSPTLGRWYGIEVSAQNKKQVWAPAGFARGFYVLSDYAELQYKCTAIYNPKGESGIRWNDPQIGIRWPIDLPIVSPRDASYPPLRELDASSLPQVDD